MKEILEDKKIIALVFLIVLMIFLILLFTFLTKKTSSTNQQENVDESIGTTKVVTQYKRPENLPVDVEIVPTLVASEGKGLDLQSAPIKESTSEISKLKGKLPFTETISSGNMKVGIVIPDRKYQDNDYTLIVNLNGIDFGVPSDDNNYFENRNAFVAGATRVMVWLKGNDVDIKKIIIKWGDKKYVNDKANVWLNYVKI